MHIFQFRQVCFMEPVPMSNFSVLLHLDHAPTPPSALCRFRLMHSSSLVVSDSAVRCSMCSFEQLQPFLTCLYALSITVMHPFWDEVEDASADPVWIHTPARSMQVPAMRRWNGLGGFGHAVSVGPPGGSTLQPRSS